MVSWKGLSPEVYKKCIYIDYDNSNDEHLSKEEFNGIINNMKVRIGSVGYKYKFIKKFQGFFCDGTVMEITSNGKLKCTFSDMVP